MAELADALGSGLSGRKLVRVQVPPSALLRIPAGKRVSCFNQPVFKVISGTEGTVEIDGMVPECTPLSINKKPGCIANL